jgi:hypothetical protein
MMQQVLANGSRSVENAIESVSLFTKFESGFDSISSDGRDRTAFVSGYHQAPRGLKWVFDVSLSPQKARYTFAKYDEVRAAAPSLGGRAAGVVGVRFSLQAIQIFDVHAFAKMFAAAFDASCEKSPAFPFKRTDGITYPTASSFDANDVQSTHEWIARCLATVAVEFTPLPKTSHNGDLYEVQTSEDPLTAAKRLLKSSGVRIANRDQVIVHIAPTIDPPPANPVAPETTTPGSTPSPAVGDSRQQQWGRHVGLPVALLGSKAWLPGVIAGTLLGGSGLALALWQQSRMEVQLSSITAAMSAVQYKLTELDVKLKASPPTASLVAAPPPKLPASGVTPENKPGGSDGQAGGAGQIDKDSSKTKKDREAEEVKKADQRRVEIEKIKREKDEAAKATRLGQVEKVNGPASAASATQRGAAAARGSGDAPTTVPAPAAAPSVAPPAPAGTDQPTAVSPKPAADPPPTPVAPQPSLNSPRDIGG